MTRIEYKEMIERVLRDAQRLKMDGRNVALEKYTGLSASITIIDDYAGYVNAEPLAFAKAIADMGKTGTTELELDSEDTKLLDEFLESFSRKDGLMQMGG